MLNQIWLAILEQRLADIKAFQTELDEFEHGLNSIQDSINEELSRLRER